MWTAISICLLCTVLADARTLSSSFPKQSNKSPNQILAATPPMGWMSWEAFRCETDCTENPTGCIDQNLYKSTADSLSAQGFVDAGYKQVSIDDCWADMDRDESGRLVPDPARFPQGMKPIADHLHALNISFGIYSDMGTKTCGGYPGSKGFEKIDAESFAEWGVDYLKMDGCYNDKEGFETGYPLMGSYLKSSGRPITYSCSWPAYLGNNETEKPFDRMIDAGCNLWRNWWDVQNTWESISSIIDHFGNYSDVLQKYTGPGHWHDMDMILCGSYHWRTAPLSVEQCQTQMTIWSIIASPLIISTDVRNITKEYKDVILNREIIAINQDPLGEGGKRYSSFGPQEVWARRLHTPFSISAWAIALYNKEKQPRNVTVEFATLGFEETQYFYIRDVLNQKDLGMVHKEFTALVPPTGVQFVRVETAE